MTSTDQSRDDDRRGGIVRRVLSSGPNPEERLEELLAQRRRELDEHAEQLHASIAELERREELLRDSRSLGRADAASRNVRPRGTRERAHRLPPRADRAREGCSPRRKRISGAGARSSERSSSSAPPSSVASAPSKSREAGARRARGCGSGRRHSGGAGVRRARIRSRGELRSRGARCGRADHGPGARDRGRDLRRRANRPIAAARRRPALRLSRPRRARPRALVSRQLVDGGAAAVVVACRPRSPAAAPPAPRETGRRRRPPR